MYHISRFLNNRIEQTEKKFEKHVEKMENNKRGERLHAQRITRYGLKFRVVSEKHIVTLCSTVFITFFLVAVLFVIKCQKCFVLGIFQSFLFLKKQFKKYSKNVVRGFESRKNVKPGRNVSFYIWIVSYALCTTCIIRVFQRRSGGFCFSCIY